MRLPPASQPLVTTRGRNPVAPVPLAAYSVAGVSQLYLVALGVFALGVFALGVFLLPFWPFWGSLFSFLAAPGPRAGPITAVFAAGGAERGAAGEPHACGARREVPRRGCGTEARASREVPRRGSVTEAARFRPVLGNTYVITLL